MGRAQQLQQLLNPVEVDITRCVEIDHRFLIISEALDVLNGRFVIHERSSTTANSTVRLKGIRQRSVQRYYTRLDFLGIENPDGKLALFLCHLYEDL